MSVGTFYCMTFSLSLCCVSLAVVREPDGSAVHKPGHNHLSHEKESDTVTDRGVLLASYMKFINSYVTFFAKQKS